MGRHISVLVPPDRPGEVDDILTRVRAGSAVDHFETLRLHKEGRLVPVSLTISLIRDTSGAVVGASPIARDISERNRLQAELEAARDKALEVSRLKSNFLATTSHEIRTPMNGVIGMTGLLLDGELDPERRDYAETIRSSGESLLTIINDIREAGDSRAARPRAAALGPRRGDGWPSADETIVEPNSAVTNQRSTDIDGRVG